MDWALDSSAALAWVLPDERSSLAVRFFSNLKQGAILWIPTLWGYEIANALSVAERRKRLTETQSAQALALLTELPLRTDNAPDANSLWRYRCLALDHGLAAYDAAYLELAERRGLGLATIDEKLSAAAKRAGVKTL
ncbi:MAG: type II toxin-antitoxin system VapC family toxin [Elusimicrobiota bacterium]